MKKRVTRRPMPEPLPTPSLNVQSQDTPNQTSAKLIPQLSLRRDVPLLVTWDGSVLWVQKYAGQKEGWSAPNYVSVELPMLVELSQDSAH